MGLCTCMCVLCLAAHIFIIQVLDDSIGAGSGAGGGVGSAQIQRCFAVRAGRDALLDVARATFNDCFDDISRLIQDYRDEFGIGSLKLHHSAARGFHMSAKCDADALPPIFIQVCVYESVCIRVCLHTCVLMRVQYDVCVCACVCVCVHACVTRALNAY